MGDTKTEVIPVPNSIKGKFQTERGLASAQLSAGWWVDPLINPDCGKIEPPNKKDGLLAYADGTNWNPGSGKGYYYYNGSIWIFLSTPLTTPTYDIPGAIEFVIDNGVLAVETGIRGELEIPFACTLQQGMLLADVTGSIEIDILKTDYSSYPSGSSITGGSNLIISSAKKTRDSTLSGWAVDIEAGSILQFEVISCTTIKRITISLKIVKL